MEDELLTVDEAAGRLKMHPVTVRRLLREGRLPGRKVGVREWRVSAAALRAYMGALTITRLPDGRFTISSDPGVALSEAELRITLSSTIDNQGIVNDLVERAKRVP